MGLRSGSPLPDDCEPIEPCPLVLPTPPPVDLHSTAAPWKWRLPLSSNENPIRYFVQGGTVFDDNRPAEVCQGLGPENFLLRLSLKKHIPTPTPTPTPTPCSSECYMVRVATSRHILVEGIPLTCPGTTDNFTYTSIPGGNGAFLIPAKGPAPESELVVTGWGTPTLTFTAFGRSTTMPGFKCDTGYTYAISYSDQEDFLGGDADGCLSVVPGYGLQIVFATEINCP